MKNLSNTQKIAIMRILMDIVMADGYVDKRELQFYHQIIQELEADHISLESLKTQNSLACLVEIDKFSKEQKQQFAQMMGRMIVVDEQIHYKEVEFYNVVRDACHLDANIYNAIDMDELYNYVMHEDGDSIDFIEENN